MKKEDKIENVNTKENKHQKNEVKRKGNVKKIIITLIQIVLIGVIIYSGYNIYVWYVDNKQNSEMKEELQHFVSVSEEKTEQADGSIHARDYNIDFEGLSKTNKDIVGWLKVNNTNIEYPVVKSSNNDYYLEHSFDGKQNGAGWVFADYRNGIDGTDKNIILYGHNRKDQSMFGSLSKVLTEEWYNNKDNLNIVFITKDEKSDYEVFSSYQVLDEEYYITTSFGNQNFGEFVNKIKSRSVHNYGVEVGEEDSILTLSTCAGNNKYRVVLHAKKK